MKLSSKKIKNVVGIFAISATVVTGFIVINPFQRSFPSVSLFNSCSADNIAGANKVDSKWITQVGNELIVQGWAADIEKKTTASEVSVQLIDSQNNVVGTWLSKYDMERPDVSAAFNNPAMVKSGLNIAIGSIAIPGLYKIQFGSINDNQIQICGVQVQVEVTGNAG